MGPSAAPRTISICLLRTDLRLHDNPLLYAAHVDPAVSYVLPLTVVDERMVELSGLPGYQRDGPPAKTRLCGFWRTGVFRTRFMVEAIYDLRDALSQRGSNLLVRFGKTELVTASVVKALQANGDVVSNVLMQKEFYSEELAIERRLEKTLRQLGVPVVFFDTTPLIDVRDLPFAVADTPDVFTPFRKRVEALGQLGRNPLPIPSPFKPCPSFGPTGDNSYGAQFDNATINDLLEPLLRPLRDSYETKFADPAYTRDPKSAFPFKGGETTALERLEWYFHQGALPPVAKYKETRNGLLGHAYSTKLSPFLCLGSISPRLIMQSLDEHERKFGSTPNTYWVQSISSRSDLERNSYANREQVRFELLWRDYFLYIARKFGNHLFKLGGFEAVTDPKQATIKTVPGWWKEWSPDVGKDHPARRWLEGRTGVPFVDANMAELRESGFMSNRGRQNVASFLTKDLQVDWRVGAEFFESHLIDYEPSANAGNWQYIAGVGNDPRASRQFNPIKQGNDYDPGGDYIKTWLPQLTSVPTYAIQCPWLLPVAEQPKDYPSKPVVEQDAWKRHYQKRGAGKLHGNPNERVRDSGALRKDVGGKRPLSLVSGLA